LYNFLFLFAFFFAFPFSYGSMYDEHFILCITPSVSKYKMF
jgi:hypothetical protein